MRGTGTPRKREVASYWRDELRWYASRRSAGPLISGPELQLTPRILGTSPAEAPAKAAEMRWTKNNDATTRAQKMRRGNEMCCAADAAGRAV